MMDDAASGAAAASPGDDGDDGNLGGVVGLICCLYFDLIHTCSDWWAGIASHFS